MTERAGFVQDVVAVAVFGLVDERDAPSARATSCYFAATA
jgi:hypothetical protein